MTEPTSAGWEFLVVAYNSEREIPRLIASIRRLAPSDARLAIWCNSDPGRLREALAPEVTASGLQVTVHGDGTNLGFAEACNRLAAASSSDIVVFLNPDTEILECPPTLDVSASRIVAPVIVSETGELQRTFGPPRTLRREAAIRLLHREAPLEQPSALHETGFVSGAAFAVDRQRFLDVGGFDPRYFMYYEDLDLCRRWRDSGGSIWVDPQFRIMHIGGASASSDPSLALQRSYESAWTFHSRTAASRRTFEAVAVIEALLKSLLAAVVGRVGIIDRRTQWGFAKWVLSRTSANVRHPRGQ